MTETDRKFPDERFKNRNYKIGLRPDLIKDCRYVCMLQTAGCGIFVRRLKL